MALVYMSVAGALLLALIIYLLFAGLLKVFGS